MNRTIGSFDLRLKNSFSVFVIFMAVHSLIRVESLNSVCVKNLELADLICTFM